MIVTMPLSIHETHRRELQAYTTVLSHVWTQVSESTSLLDAEPTQVEDACTLLIDLLRMLHTVAGAAAAYVEPRPLQVSLSCRLAPAQVTDTVEETIRSLVLLRDTCRSMPWANERERRHAVQQMRDLHTHVQQTITTLETEARRFAAERSSPCL